ncbi:WD40-repeat-containing domain protein [Chaetomidium leptoderma]|uniref:WD40-repeat-containing domain protein n=1 Tax=Chaetomidium leptoderma TaxID=669021 RepID=A0AAN6VTG7_9PEZI|nr:WD40-repeat-containing domain protein [Chaetomidium leptoderma]
MWNVENGALLYTFEGHSKPVRSVCWASDGQTIASGSHDHTVRLWDAVAAKCRFVLYAGSAVNMVAICKAQPTVEGITYEGIVAGGSVNGYVKLWDIRTGSLVKCLDNPDGGEYGVYGVAFSYNRTWNDTLLVAGFENQVKTWWLGRDLKRTHDGHRGIFHGVTFLPTTPFFVSASRDGCVAIWDYNRGKPSALLRLNYSGQTISAVAEAPGGSVFAIATSEGTVRLWSLHHRSTGIY